MNNNLIKEAKKVYLQSGRLNQNIVRKEISISWYKCKLQSLDVDASIKSTNQTIERKFDQRFIKFINSVLPTGFMFVLANPLLQVVDYKLDQMGIENIDSIDDLAIGTNAGYLAMKTGNDTTVNLDEHYLNIFSNYYSIGIVLKKNENIDGVLMLFSELPINEYTIHGLKSEIANYYNKDDYRVTFEDKSTLINLQPPVPNTIIYPIVKYNQLLVNIDRIFKSSKLLIIRGDVKTGKTALAYDFCIKHKCIPAIVDLGSLNAGLHTFMVQTALSQFDTIILKNFQRASVELIKLLMVYNDEKDQNNNGTSSCNIKSCTRILATINSSSEYEFMALENGENNRLFKFFEDKYQLFTVNLLKISEAVKGPEFEEIIKQLENKYNTLFSNKFIEHLKHSYAQWSNVEMFEYVEKAMEYNRQLGSSEVKYIPADTVTQLISLSEHEKKYVLEVYNALNQNISAVADVLQIGRSTLYRKLNLYQIETSDTEL